MDVTDIMRRSDALYHDNIRRRDLCDRIAYLEADLKEVLETVRRLKALLEGSGAGDGGR